VIQPPSVGDSITITITITITVTGWIVGKLYECQQQLRCWTHDNELVFGWHVREHVSQPPSQDQLSRQFQQQQRYLDVPSNA
jgi:hypothetical protein